MALLENNVNYVFRIDKIIPIKITIVFCYYFDLH